MAVSASIVQTARPPGDQVFTVTDLTLSEKYVESGEEFTAANVGLRSIAFAFSLGIKTLGSGSTVNVANSYISVASTKTTAKVILRDETPAEVASEAEIKKPTLTIVAFGKP